MNERELFEAALEITDAAARKVYLDETCASQPELRARLDELLESHAVAGEFGAMNEIESKLAMVAGPDGKKYFPVKTDLGEGEVELRISINPIARSLDAYPKYLEMFADGLATEEIGSRARDRGACSVPRAEIHRGRTTATRS